MDIGRCNDWNSKMADISGVGSCNEISRNCPVISPLLSIPLTLSRYLDDESDEIHVFNSRPLYPSLLKVYWITRDWITNISNKKYLDPSIVDSSRCRKWKKWEKALCAHSSWSYQLLFRERGEGREREIRSFRTKGS